MATAKHLSLFLITVALSGCAPAYHSYSECRVDCKYCAPPPLPFLHYEGCVCHSCVAYQHLHTHATSATLDDDGHEAEVQE